jgi:hypothetical protein
MMQGGRSLLILLIVALGLGAYIYFVESERDPAGTVTRESVFDVEREDITALTVRAAGADDATALERTDDGWTITAPAQARADQMTVDAILSAITAMQIERVIEENPTDLAQYGLEPAEVEVTFTTAGGASHTLAVGNATPTGSGMYARTGDTPRLLLVPSYHKASINKTTFDLRDRRVLDVAQATVERVGLTRPNQPALLLERADGAWRIAAPIEARADAGPVDSLVSRLSSARMSSIVDEGSEPSAADLAKWGLDKPRLTATLGSGSSSATLAIGAEQGDSGLYARDLARNLVFTVDRALLTDLDKTAADFRVKDIFTFTASSARRIEITRAGTTYIWEKATRSDADNAQPTWTRVQPEASDVNQTTITDLLNALASLRAESFESSAPSPGETIAVLVQYETGGTSREDSATLRYAESTASAVKANEPGAAILSSDDVASIVGHIDALTTSTDESGA